MSLPSFDVIETYLTKETMPEPRIALPWWPLAPDGRIGDDRARALVAALQIAVGPVVDETGADFILRSGSGTDIVRSASPASYIARFRFDDPPV